VISAVESADWLTVVHVDEGIEREARAWLRRHDERIYSFVDATSFVVMRRERLGEARPQRDQAQSVEIGAAMSRSPRR
jgi:predicted nucleic acid-binding protein